jgi:hypothetical protein
LTGGLFFASLAPRGSFGWDLEILGTSASRQERPKVITTNRNNNEGRPGSPPRNRNPHTDFLRAANTEGLERMGPDLLFLRIPTEYVGRIEAVKSFYSLDRDRPQVKLGVEVLFLMGAPGEFGKYTPQHAELNINGFQFDANALPHRHGEFDYLDSKEDTKFPGVPKSFGGVSGGGLWRVQIFDSPDPGKLDWKWFLQGVAFWQIPQPDEHMTVRCHGPESIQTAMKLVPANPQKRE